MVIVVLVWGATFVVIKDALNDISPLLFNLLRMSLATATLALVYRRHLRSLSLRAWISGAVVGACLAMGYQFQTAGLALTTPSKSAFLTGLVVVIVPLLLAIPALRAPGYPPSRLECLCRRRPCLYRHRSSYLTAGRLLSFHVGSSQFRRHSLPLLCLRICPPRTRALSDVAEGSVSATCRPADSLLHRVHGPEPSPL